MQFSDLTSKTLGVRTIASSMMSYWVCTDGKVMASVEVEATHRDMIVGNPKAFGLPAEHIKAIKTLRWLDDEYEINEIRGNAMRWLIDTGKWARIGTSLRHWWMDVGTLDTGRKCLHVLEDKKIFDLDKARSVTVDVKYSETGHPDIGTHLLLKTREEIAQFLNPEGGEAEDKTADAVRRGILGRFGL